LFLILFLPAFWLGLFLLIPLFFVAFYGLSFYDDAYILQNFPLDWRNYQDALSLGRGAVVIPLVLRTFAVATATAVVSLALGYAMAYYIARLAKERWRGILMALIVIPFWVSFIVRIYATAPFSNKASFIHDGLRSAGLGGLSDFIAGTFELGTGHMVVFTLMYVWLPFMILPLFASLSKLDPQLLEAAHDLGASRWRAFLHVTLPLTFPAIVVGSILVFITSVGAFIETELVGGRAWLLIGNYIQTQFNIVGGLPQAASSAVFIIVVTALLIGVYRKYAELEEEGETEVRSRVIAPLARLIRRALGGRKAREPTPGVTTMPDGGVVAPATFRTTAGEPFHKPTWEKVLDTLTEKGGKIFLAAVTALMLVMFFLPLIIMAVFSFNSEPDLFYFHGFSTEWWVGSSDRDGFFQDRDALASIWWSFAVALASSLLAVFIGMFAAFAISRYTFRARGVLRSLMYLGLVIPSLVLGLSLAVLIKFLNDLVLGPLSMGYSFSVPLQWDYGFSTIVAGHTTFNIPLATLVLLISFREFDRTLEEAAMNLGADEITTFLKVTFPNIMPGVISAILLGFTFSFDELPVSLFLAGGGVVTVPMFIYGLVSKKILTPRVNAASVVVLLLSLVFVLVTTRIARRGGQLFRI